MIGNSVFLLSVSTRIGLLTLTRVFEGEQFNLYLGAIRVNGFNVSYLSVIMSPALRW